MNAHVTAYYLSIISLLESIRADVYTICPQRYMEDACDRATSSIHGWIAANEGFWEPELSVFG